MLNDFVMIMNLISGGLLLFFALIANFSAPNNFIRSIFYLLWIWATAFLLGSVVYLWYYPLQIAVLIH